MVTVLIPTIQDDIHAAAVAHVLEQRGHRAIRWFCGDLPAKSTATFTIAGDAPASAELRDEGPPVSLDEVGVFWNRRVADPILGDELISADREFAARETKRLVRGLLLTCSERTFAVNDFLRSIAAENKVLQLAAAREVGFAVPETLISNDPDRIRRFVDRHPTDTICKPFRPVTWERGDQVAILYTSLVGPDDLPRDSLLQLGPSIFQARVPKRHEVRVTCMGAELFAVRLDSQRTQTGAIDWRLSQGDELGIEPLALPAGVAASCRDLMRRFGLVFGCFDFIVTPDGEYVFLEINQMGQFLWIEDEQPSVPLLDAFCEFLVSRDPQFVYRGSGQGAAMADVTPLAVEMIERDRTCHVQPRQYRHIVHE